MTKIEGAVTEVRDEAYWEKYYQTGAAPLEPSSFARYVAERYVQKGQSLIELGCGNGRDAHFFATRGVGVLAVDQCVKEIAELSKSNDSPDHLRYVTEDFTALPDSVTPFDVVYSRFTLHSVTEAGQAQTLDWSFRNLAPGGLLCVETRGQKNEIFQLGEPVEGDPNAFVYEDHYRRFVDFEDFQADLNKAGFTVVEAAEATGFAPYQDTDYHFIRAIAQK